MRRLILFALCSLSLQMGCGPSEVAIAVGTLERHRIELRAERSEPLLRLTVSEGQQVRPGDVIVELDSRRAMAQLEAARASRDLAAAVLAEVVRGARREELDRARAELAEAQAALVELQPELRRIERLVQDGVEPQSSVESAEAALTAAEARREATAAALERLLNGATVEELDQARADLARTQAEIARLEVDVERLTIRAPRAATVDALPFKAGDEPPVGAVVAILLVDEAPFARVYVPAEIRPRVVAGNSVTVSVDGFSAPFEGRVRMISSEATFTPYYSLTERDRRHLAYVGEIDLIGEGTRDLPTGLPVEVSF